MATDTFLDNPALTLGQILGPSKHPNGDVGMELEVEAKVSLPQISTKAWVTKDDGSLRYVAREYVSNGPQDITKVEDQVDYLLEKLADPALGVIQNSPRTSFHVHVNVRDLTHVQVVNSLVAYWFIEPVLVKIVDKSRTGNCFCLTLDKSEEPLDALAKIVRAKDSSFYHPDEFRYASQNMASIGRFGSIENRLKDGSMDKAFMVDWVKSLFNIKVQAATYSDPTTLLNELYRMSKYDLVRKFLVASVQTKVLGLKNYEELLETNEIVLNKFANRFNWKTWGDSFKTVPAKKKTNAYQDTLLEAMQMDLVRARRGADLAVNPDMWATADSVQVHHNPTPRGQR